MGKRVPVGNIEVPSLDIPRNVYQECQGYEEVHKPGEFNLGKFRDKIGNQCYQES